MFDEVSDDEDYMICNLCEDEIEFLDLEEHIESCPIIQFELYGAEIVKEKFLESEVFSDKEMIEMNFCIEEVINKLKDQYKHLYEDVEEEDEVDDEKEEEDEIENLEEKEGKESRQRKVERKNSDKSADKNIENTILSNKRDYNQFLSSCFDFGNHDQNLTKKICLEVLDELISEETQKKHKIKTKNYVKANKINIDYEFWS